MYIHTPQTTHKSSLLHCDEWIGSMTWSMCIDIVKKTTVDRPQVLHKGKVMYTLSILFMFHFINFEVLSSDITTTRTRNIMCMLYIARDLE